VDETAIKTYIGEIERVLAAGSPRKVVVRIKEPPLADRPLPIWDLQVRGSSIRATRFG